MAVRTLPRDPPGEGGGGGAKKKNTNDVKHFQDEYRVKKMPKMTLIQNSYRAGPPEGSQFTRGFLILGFWAAGNR